MNSEIEYWFFKWDRTDSFLQYFDECGLHETKNIINTINIVYKTELSIARNLFGYDNVNWNLGLNETARITNVSFHCRNYIYLIKNQLLYNRKSINDGRP